MASLIEDLVDVLGKENAEYQNLLELSLKKTPVIIQGNVDELSLITENEQAVLSRINKVDKARVELMKDIATVINRDSSLLTLKKLIEFLGQRPEEQKKLAKLHDELKSTIKQVGRVNGQNRELIHNALEMVEFDMNLVRSMKKAPETANYNNIAYNTGSYAGVAAGQFDTRQ